MQMEWLIEFKYTGNIVDLAKFLSDFENPSRSGILNNRDNEEGDMIPVELTDARFIGDH